MKILSFVIIIVVLILSGCKKDEGPTSVPAPVNSSGSIMLTFNETSIPQGVTQISAELTRSGFDNRTGTVNMLQDSSADISFSKVPAGIWYLKVDAKDASNIVLYTGATDITVKQDSIAQVYLTLSPTTGGIHVIVTWGAQKKVWIDYASNPILTNSDTTLHARWIFGPQILSDSGIYKMWYTNLIPTSNIRVVSYLTSKDGTNWLSGYPTPVLKPGSSSEWDYNNVGAGPVIKDGSLYRTYYGNSSDFANPWEIGLATSTDGVHWTKYPTPILTKTYTWEVQLGAGDVLKIGSMFYLYYTASGSLGATIALATSTDGVVFTKYSDQPLMKGTESWESGGVCTPSIMYEGGVYTMVYSVANSSGLGIATSTDGKNWTKDAKNPFFTLQDVVNGWTKNKIAYICYRKIGTEYRVYYSGYDTAKDRWMIGYAKKL